jgi:hypothetical protein
MKHLPSVTEARYVRDYIIETTFDDGTTKAIDFTHWLDGPVFEPLKNKKYFRKFFLDGSTIAWPNGADIAPETLYDDALGVESTRNKRLLRRVRNGARLKRTRLRSSR